MFLNTAIRWKGMNTVKRPRLKVVVHIALMFSLIVFVFWKSPFGDTIATFYHHHSLTKRGDLPEIAAAMRTMLTDQGNNDLVLKSREVGFPPILKDLGARWLVGRPYEVTVEFGAGFYHYGYRLERRQSPSGFEFHLISYGEYPENDEELLKLPWRETKSVAPDT